MSSLAKPVAEPEVPAGRPPIPWATVAWFAVLLIVCYLPVLIRLVRQWNADDDMGHGFFVPVVAAYIAWQKRDELLAAPIRSNPLGLVLIFLGAVQLYVGTLGAELFLARTAFMESVVGVVLYVGGFQALKILSFPLFLLCFMIPLPAVIYNQITLPLQLLASDLAARILELVGVPVLRDGNILELQSQKLSVVEACSGIRSLLTLSFLSLVYGYFFEQRGWMRAFLLVSTIPIAILANASRVTITGILSEVNPELAHGLAHTASGWVIFMIALAILLVWHTVANRLAKVVFRA